MSYRNERQLDGDLVVINAADRDVVWNWRLGTWVFVNVAYGISPLQRTFVRQTMCSVCTKRHLTWVYHQGRRLRLESSQLHFVDEQSFRHVTLDIPPMVPITEPAQIVIVSDVLDFDLRSGPDTTRPISHATLEAWMPKFMRSKHVRVIGRGGPRRPGYTMFLPTQPLSSNHIIIHPRQFPGRRPVSEHIRLHSDIIVSILESDSNGGAPDELLFESHQPVTYATSGAAASLDRQVLGMQVPGVLDGVCPVSGSIVLRDRIQNNRLSSEDGPRVYSLQHLDWS